MQKLDGRKLAETIKEEIAAEVKTMLAAGHKRPHLAAVLVGENPASQVYVGNKVRSCEQVGFKSTLVQKSADITQEELIQAVEDLNNDPDIDGFIVQLPLPAHLDEDAVNLAIDYRKDVDGFHPMNFGRMAQGMASYLPATPFGIMQMLERYEIDTQGKEVVVLGRSNIVGTPMSILLSRKAKIGNATVQLCHSRTVNLPGHTRKADILIAAIGRADFVTADMVKEGAVVIDVGINRVDDPSKKRGYRLTGDVDYASVSEKASYLTPVPGGVGPMTVCSLLMNTLKSCKGEIYPKS